MPQPFAPILTVLGAMLLALVSVGWLLFFIHHISHAISVNHIVDRIARETEEVIDALMPHQRTNHFAPAAAPFVPEEPEFPILNEVSGYIRFIDTATAAGIRPDAPSARPRHPPRRPFRAGRGSAADGVPPHPAGPRTMRWT